jgi:uncharacterized protein YecE (DUF72 family)
MSFYVGTAAWNLPKDFMRYFPLQGSHLERYSKRLHAVEINSSFYRHHRPQSYLRWSASVPADFRFAVKLSRNFTHQQKLAVHERELAEVLRDIGQLGDRLGVLLVQIPPSLVFEPEVADHFFISLRRNFEGPVAFEPRHLSWSSSESCGLLKEYRISKVWADPDLRESEHLRAFTSDLAYFRLHGKPEIYRSRYAPEDLKLWMLRMCEAARDSREIWCIFDNTTFGFATANALEMQESLENVQKQESQALCPGALLARDL